MKLESDLNKLKKIKRRKHKLTKIILLRMMEYKDNATNIMIIISLICYGLLSISILSIDYGITILQVLFLAIPMYLSLFIMHEVYKIFVLWKNIEIQINILVNSYQKELKEDAGGIYWSVNTLEYYKDKRKITNEKNKWL